MAMGRGGEDDEPLGPARVTTGLDTLTEELSNKPSESADRGRVRPSHAVTIKRHDTCDWTQVWGPKDVKMLMF